LRKIGITEPSPVTLGSTLTEILEEDKKSEEEAIRLYNEIIEAAQKEGDEMTATLFRRILEDEEKHHRLFSNLLQDMQSASIQLFEC
jgi:bacterioferritin